MSDERLTLIVVPHGDLETRRYEISYTKLKVLLGVAGVLLLAFVVVASSWWYVASQAARVPGLESEVARLEAEREKVAELAQTLSVVETQYERVRRMLGADAAPEGREPWLPPLDTEDDGEAGSPGSGPPDAWPLTQTGFITRALTGNDGQSDHPGVDIAVPQDSYISAAGGGVVRDAGRDDVYGYFVLIEHGDGYQSMYGHASRLFVDPGDRVERKEVVALSGSTGRSTAPHLHFEIRKDGRVVDPLTLVEQP